MQPNRYQTMQKFVFILCLFMITGCGTKKTTYSSNKDFEATRKVSVTASDENTDTIPRVRKRRSRKVSVEASEPETSITQKRIRKRKTTNYAVTKADKIINTALTFSGTRYKWGGTTKKGMDCSGLLYVSFSEHDVQLPRVSEDMAEKGRKVKLKNVEKGDLIFFKTKRGRRINHVGMVVAIEDDEIKFIHASSSRGVIVSSLREGYWNSAFVKATRIL